MHDRDAENWLRWNNAAVPEFSVTAFVKPPPLGDARVAILTTGALHRPDQEAWGRSRDQSFRVLEQGDRNLRLGHFSPNFDRVAIAADLNVVYPVDRLDEMVAEGAIGSVGPHNLSFLGAQDETMSTIRLDTGPAAARVLLDDGVDVVLLTPV